MMREQIGFLGRLSFRSVLGFCVAICALGPSLQARATPTISTFDAPGAGTAAGQGTFAASINSKGAIVGSYSDSSGVYPYFRTPNGLISTFQPVPDAAPKSIASSINDYGVIAGTFLASAKLNIYDGFVRATDGTTTPFIPPTGRYFMSVAGINNSGLVAGSFTNYCGWQEDDCTSFGYIWASSGGASTTFGVTGAINTYVSGFNAKGTVAGYYTDSNSLVHGYVRTSDGTITTIDVAGAEGTVAVGSTGKGVIAGDYVDGSGVTYGFVREPTGGIRKLNASGTMGGEGTLVTAINGRGVITGYYFDTSGVSHGYVRVPNGNVTTFDAPGAGMTTNQGTFPASISTTGLITGDYVDGSGVYHGFVRIP